MIFDVTLLLPAADKSERDFKSHLKITYTRIVANIRLSKVYRSSAAACPASLGAVAPKELPVGLLAV